MPSGKLCRVSRVQAPKIFNPQGFGFLLIYCLIGVSRMEIIYSFVETSLLLGLVRQQALTLFMNGATFQYLLLAFSLLVTCTYSLDHGYFEL